MTDVYFWRQCFILSSGLLYSLCIGFMLAYPAVLNQAILSPNSTDIVTTASHASWIAASNGIAGMLGSCILAYIFQYHGRKILTICINLGLLIGWIIFPLSTSIKDLYAARIIQGLSVGGIHITSIIISEYVHPSRRGAFVTLKKLFSALGILVCHAMGPFYTWRQISLFAAVPQTIALLLTLFWPESPHYLAQKGNTYDCEKSFKWLNGSSEESQRHLKQLLDANAEPERNHSSLKNIWKMMKKKDFQKSFYIVSILTLAIDLCGRYYFVAYVVQIMTELLENQTSVMYITLGADILTLVALSLSSVIVRYFNRRTLLFSLGGLSILLMFLVSLFVFLKSVYDFGPGLSLFTAAIIVFQIFISNLGIIPLSFTLIGEVIPLEYKGLSTCVSGIVSTLLYGTTLKLTPVLIESTGLQGTYSIYAVWLALCLVILYKIVPETKNKTLQEIEDRLNGTDQPVLQILDDKKIARN